MRAEALTGVPIDGAQALARHLQEHPEAAHASPAKLAALFNLSQGFVEEVLSAVRPPEERTHMPLAPARSMFRSFRERAMRLFTRATDRLAMFVLVTGAIATAVSALLQVQFYDQLQLPSWAFNVQWSVIIVMWCLQFAAYARHARVRVAILGSLINWMLAAPVAMILKWSEIRYQPGEVVMLDLLYTAGQSFVLYTNYALIASVAAVAGAYIRQRRVEVNEQRLSRQELLERLFEIQEKLSAEEGVEPKPDRRDVWIRRFRVHWPMKSFLVGLAFGFGHITLLILAGGLRPGSAPTVGATLLTPVFTSTDIVLLGLCGFLSGSLLRAQIACWLYQLGTFIPMMIPVPSTGLGIQSFINRFSQNEELIKLVATTLVAALVAGLGAGVEERWQRIRRLRQDEPAALLAEMVRIQWRLSPRTADVCVMVVDVVRSSYMKAMSDPLLVEYSFREYQRLVSNLSARWHGTVHSTAGDGVVVAFPSCDEAYAAAKNIITGLEAFNREVNRLELPFRVRIGIHVGPVAGELNMVQFTEVIDIAAHAQDATEPGTIAVTQPVAEQLGLPGFEALPENVDGHSVFVSRLVEA